MRSFPSTFNRSGNALLQIGKTRKTDMTDTMSGQFQDARNIKTYNVEMSPTVKAELVSDKYINLPENKNFITDVQINKDKSDKRSEVENPMSASGIVLSQMNRYRFIYKTPTRLLGGVSKGANGNDNILYTAVTSSPSIFNPLFNVQALGMVENTPLLINSKENTVDKIPEPTIRNLVAESHKKDSILGNARFRYADFMYCKNLGKVPNNRLIVLRKFALPVPDNIYRYSTPKYRNPNSAGFMDYTTRPDVGRLVTWFDTEDNKLEDILHYQYEATWEEWNAGIEELPSMENNEQRGWFGLLANMNPQYNQLAEQGLAGDHNFISKLFGKFGWRDIKSDNEEALLRNYDLHKVYEPKDTIRNQWVYKGELKFSHEFTLKFSYKLRAYDNISPKSAMLDLLANILEVTYRHGTFWGGQQKIVGPRPNTQAWKEAEAFVDNAWESMGGIMAGMANGNINFSELLGSLGKMIGGAATELLGKVKSVANDVIDTVKEKGITGALNEGVKNLSDNLLTIDSKTGFSKALKGQLKNKFGRPAMYAFKSLLTGDDTGLWHVTVGNPFNPILTMGNMIVKTAEIQHSGPLGIDDFPTDLTVTVNLTHARSRDIGGIEKMYTRGMGQIYLPTANHKMSDFYDYGDTNLIDDAKTGFDAAIAKGIQVTASIDEKTDKAIADASKEAESKTQKSKKQSEQGTEDNNTNNTDNTDNNNNITVTNVAAKENVSMDELPVYKLWAKEASNYDNPDDPPAKDNYWDALFNEYAAKFDTLNTTMATDARWNIDEISPSQTGGAV